MDKEEKKKLKEWNEAVKIRDNHSCAICGSKERLNAHHIIPIEKEETRFMIENGLSLCVSHHKFSRDISAHNNSFAFFVWLMSHRYDQYNFLLNWCVKNGAG